MKVLVTGGAGFIGSHSVDLLLRAQFPVRVLDNFSTGRPENLRQQSGLEVQIGDIRSIDDVNRAMRGVSHVLHLAAQVSQRDSVEHPVNSCSHNVRGFVNVVEAARRSGVQRFVYASDAAVYGDQAAAPLDERAPARPLTPYALEKLINDQYAAMYRELYGLPCLGLRYFSVYGPREQPRTPYTGVVSRFVDCVRRGEPIPLYGDGLQTRDFVFVGDVAEANRRGLMSACQGLLNVATGCSTSLVGLVDALEKCAGRALAVEHLARRVGDVRHRAAQVEAVGRELGFVPATSMADALASMLSEETALAA